MLAKQMQGRTYGRLTVIGLDRTLDSRSKVRTLIRVLCSCGTIKVVDPHSVIRGRSSSCGCLNAQLSSERRRSHGMTGTPTHRIWVGMVRRCYDHQATSYQRYGAKGVRVCDRWRNSFENFLSDMGERPGGMTLDRIDNSRGYEPGNCRWATVAEQARNRTDNHSLTFNGRTMVMTDWAKEIGISVFTLAGRLRSGWPVDRALTTPVRNNARRQGYCGLAPLPKD